MEKYPRGRCSDYNGHGKATWYIKRIFLGDDDIDNR